MSNITHLCPPGDSDLTACCGRSPHELLADRITLDPSLVTCPGKPAPEPQSFSPTNMQELGTITHMILMSMTDPTFVPIILIRDDQVNGFRPMEDDDYIKENQPDE
jgi:hypothetical protein